MEFLTAALGVLTLAALAGVGLQRGRVSDLRDQLSDARNQIADLKTGRAEGDQLTARLQHDLEALGRVVTGEAHWVAISQQLDMHHDQATAHWGTSEARLTEIRDALLRRAT